MQLKTDLYFLVLLRSLWGRNRLINGLMVYKFGLKKWSEKVVFCYCVFTSWCVAPANFYWSCELPAAQKIVCFTRWTWLDAYTHFKQKIRIKRKRKQYHLEGWQKGKMRPFWTIFILIKLWKEQYFSWITFCAKHQFIIDLQGSRSAWIIINLQTKSEVSGATV